MITGEIKNRIDSIWDFLEFLEFNKRKDDGRQETQYRQEI